MKVTVFWDVTPHNLVGGVNVSEEQRQYLPDCALSTLTLIIHVEFVATNKAWRVFDIRAAFKLCIANGCVVT
jgi:hypothetical protein